MTIQDRSYSTTPKKSRVLKVPKIDNTEKRRMIW